MELNETLLGTLIAAAVVLITALSTGLRELIATWFAVLKHRLNVESYINQLECFGKFLREIEMMREIKNVHRVLLFRGHNSGGLPTPGHSYSIRAVFGWAKNSSDPNTCNYGDEDDPDDTYGFEILADADYMSTIAKVMTDRCVFLKVAEMPGNSKLRRFLEAEQVKHAMIIFMGIVDRVNLLFMVVSTYNNEEFSQTDVTRIELAADKIRSMITCS